ncbi:TolC family protein [Sphingobacterium suaedae]|uniref:TolC family protein n=1 Tax=Sphingobacterium suaedae TaxID=1686402 RepID=A0ABW5KDR6_9SPHI
MIRKLSSCIFLLLFFLAVGGSKSYAQISLERAIETMLERNLQIRQAQFGVRLTEQTLYQSKSELYPNLSFGASNSYNYGLTFDQTSGQLIRGNDWTSNAGAQLSSSVAVFQGFQKINQIKANKIQLSIDITEVDKVKNDLVLSVVTNYLEAITNGELFEAAQQQAELSKEQLRQDSIQFAVGNKTVADLAQAENQVATDELNIMTSENAYQLSMLNLKQLMEMSPDTVFTLIKPNIADVMAEYAVTSFDDVFSQALITQPGIEQAGYNKQLALRNIDIAKGAYFPTINVSAGYGTNYSSQALNPLTQAKWAFFDQFNENKSFRGTISLEVPIFNNNRTKVAVSKAKINYLQAENDAAITRRNLEKTIAQAILDLRSANKQYFASQIAFNTSKVAYETIKERYDVGMANSIEMFTAQTNMNKAEFDMIRRKYEMVFRGKVIDYYIGKPITF